MSGSVDPTNHNTVQNNHKSKEALSETRHGKEPGLEPSETCGRMGGSHRLDVHRPWGVDSPRGTYPNNQG